MVVVALTDGGETRFVWNDETKISGTLSPGAKVTVRYDLGSGGETSRSKSASPRA